ncbi:MAG: flippase-like domain-containing protein [Bacteroidetes bacterium]|nr:flippase-like domain-containing protein [Bacteroidota bacterium]
MNKSTKIWLNALVGLAISVLLLFSIYHQIHTQLVRFPNYSFSGLSTRYLFLCLILMPFNMAIEVLKWKFLSNAAQPTTLADAWKSYFAGIALSLITPNRIGEYPGRLLYLKRKNTVRLVSVSILGAFTQFVTLFFYGIIGLCYYNFAFPGYWQQIALGISFIVLALLLVAFFLFEQWASWIENFPWLRRLHTYRSLIHRFSMSEQLIVLGLSMLRFLIYSVQFLLLLAWMNIPLLTIKGWLLTTLYFWCIAVIPSIAFAELGIRGQVSLFIFQSSTGNVIGVLIASLGLWAINLILPALIGSVLLIRIRFFK